MTRLLYRFLWAVPTRDAVRDRVALVYRLACAEWRADRLRRELDDLKREHRRLWAAYRHIEDAECGARDALYHERRQKPPRPYVTDTDQEQETPAA